VVVLDDAELVAGVALPGGVPRVGQGDHDPGSRRPLDETLQELCDEIFTDYLKQYQDIHGKPPMGQEARLFEIAVNHIKIIHGDNWAAERPDAVDSGNPIVDRERKETKYGPRITHSESVVVGTQQKLRREDRAWLKDMGLLEDPESQKADAISKLKEAWKTSAQDGDA